MQSKKTIEVGDLEVATKQSAVDLVGRVLIAKVDLQLKSALVLDGQKQWCITVAQFRAIDGADGKAVLLGLQLEAYFKSSCAGGVDLTIDALDA